TKGLAVTGKGLAVTGALSSCRRDAARFPSSQPRSRMVSLGRPVQQPAAVQRQPPPRPSTPKNAAGLLVCSLYAGLSGWGILEKRVAGGLVGLLKHVLLLQIDPRAGLKGLLRLEPLQPGGAERATGGLYMSEDQRLLDLLSLWHQGFEQG